MLSAGIKGVLNFAPICLKAPGGCIVNNINLETELENLIYFVNAAERRELTEYCWPVSLKTRILLSFLLVILVLSVPTAVLGYRVIQKNIIRRADRQVRRQHQCGAEIVYTGEIERIGEALKLVSSKENVEALRNELNRALPAARGRGGFRHACAARSPGRRCRRASRWGDPDHLAGRAGDHAGRRSPARPPIEIKPTPKARPTDKKVLHAVMAKEYAVPIFDEAGQIQAVLYGGRMVNRDYTFVDRVREMVFGKEIYKDKPVGTVTIFLDDVRIATNVQDEAGQRAIGTRVSDEVYRGRGRAGADLARAGLCRHRLLQERLPADPGHPAATSSASCTSAFWNSRSTIWPGRSSSFSCCRSAA